MLKGLILIGGPRKGTRFRPLSLDRAKPLFPVAGVPTIQHHLERLSSVPRLREVLLLGFYEAAELGSFLAEMGEAFPQLSIRYLEEPSFLDTGGGLLRFRHQILGGGPEGIFLINGDVCGDLPLADMLDFTKAKPEAMITALVTEATREQSLNYGSLVLDPQSQEVMHYVEKPKTFISTTINTGVYFLRAPFLKRLEDVAREKLRGSPKPGRSQVAAVDDSKAIPTVSVSLERDVFPSLASSSTFFAFRTERWWSQLKSAGAAIYANRHCLALYPPSKLAKGEGIQGHVYVDPEAVVEDGAVVGPNVSVGAGARIGAGARVREAIILEGAQIGQHSLVTNAIVDCKSSVGEWSRVIGTPTGPNPNMAFAKMEAKPLFRPDGRLNPAITILGSSARVPPESILLNSIVLPHKELSGSYKNQIIL